MWPLPPLTPLMQPRPRPRLTHCRLGPSRSKLAHALTSRFRLVAPLAPQLAVACPSQPPTWTPVHCTSSHLLRNWVTPLPSGSRRRHRQKPPPPSSIDSYWPRQRELQLSGSTPWLPLPPPPTLLLKPLAMLRMLPPDIAYTLTSALLRLAPSTPRSVFQAKDPHPAHPAAATPLTPLSLRCHDRHHLCLALPRSHPSLHRRHRHLERSGPPPRLLARGSRLSQLRVDRGHPAAPFVTAFIRSLRYVLRTRTRSSMLASRNTVETSMSAEPRATAPPQTMLP